MFFVIILIVLREAIWIGYQILAYFRKAYSLTVVLDRYLIYQSSLAVGFRLAYTIQLTSLYCRISVPYKRKNVRKVRTFFRH